MRKTFIAENWAILVVLVLSAVLLRLTLFPHQSLDATLFFVPWYEYIKVHGWQAYRDAFSNYYPMYTYLLGVGGLIIHDGLVCIKMISILFDFIAAFLIYRLILLRFPHHQIKAFLGSMVFLFFPTVVINSSYWGQNDIIYMTMMLAAIYFVSLNDGLKNFLLAVICWGFACSFKGQGLFFLPFFIFICMRRGFNLGFLLLAWVICVITIIPCLLAGRSLKSILATVWYQFQSGGNSSLNVYAPNLYVWIPSDPLFLSAGVIYCFAMLVLLHLVLMHLVRKEALEEGLILKLALLYALIVPFFLPKMHDRYFFAADILSVLYAVHSPRRFYVPLLVGGASFFSYGAFLFGTTVIPFHYLALMVLSAIIIVGVDIIRTIKTRGIDRD